MQETEPTEKRTMRRIFFEATIWILNNTIIGVANKAKSETMWMIFNARFR